MADHVDPRKRSLIMAAVHSKNTGPELAVRKIVHGLGYRYRLHVDTLPGKPDLVFRSRRKVVFVHGCFWHRHRRCRYASLTTRDEARRLLGSTRIAGLRARPGRARDPELCIRYSEITVTPCFA